MKRRTKRFLASALAFVMAFSMVSNDALAAGVAGKITPEQGTEMTPETKPEEDLFEEQVESSEDVVLEEQAQASG